MGRDRGELIAEQVAKANALHAKSASEGQHRTTALHGGAEYHSVGFDEFILSGYPHLEEAYWFAEGVLPLLKQKRVA